MREAARAMTRSQWLGYKLEKNVTLFNRGSLILVVSFVGVCAWFGGAEWERAHYVEKPAVFQQCLERQQEPVKATE